MDIIDELSDCDKKEKHNCLWEQEWRQCFFRLVFLSIQLFSVDAKEDSQSNYVKIWLAYFYGNVAYMYQGECLKCRCFIRYKCRNLMYLSVFAYGKFCAIAHKHEELWCDYNTLVVYIRDKHGIFQKCSTHQKPP